VFALTMGSKDHNDCSGDTMDTFTPIWDRIAANAGAEFRQKTGRPFTYSLVGNAIVPSTTNRMLARSQFHQAHQRSPLQGPGQLQDLQGPSYLFAVLTDPRVAQDNPPRPTPPDGIAESQEDFDKRLAETGYGDHDWSQEDKVYLRASGLI
jgi:hypothetical protein